MVVQMLGKRSDGQMSHQYSKGMYGMTYRMYEICLCTYIWNRHTYVIWLYVMLVRMILHSIHPNP